MSTLSPEEIALYRQSAEVHAAVHAAANIAMDYAARQDRDELLVALIKLFASYDRLRTEQAERLKAQNTDLLRRVYMPCVSIMGVKPK